MYTPRRCSRELVSTPPGAALEVHYSSSGIPSLTIADRRADLEKNPTQGDDLRFTELGVGKDSVGIAFVREDHLRLVLYASTRRTVVTVLLRVPPSVQIATDRASLTTTAQELLRWAIAHEPTAVPGTK